MKKYAIIVAGGVGSRSGDSLPKQFHQIAGRPMLWWSIRAFHAEDPKTSIIVVMHPDYMEYWRSVCGEDCPAHDVVAGGMTRTASVAAGLSAIKDFGEDSLVAVHDAARPMVSTDVIRSAWNEASLHEAVVPVVPVTDTLREGSTSDSRVVDRSRYFVVQTPQTFHLDLLKEAYAAAETAADMAFTDDASVMEWHGRKVHLTGGDPSNFKVTWPRDFIMAEALLKPANAGGVRFC